MTEPAESPAEPSPAEQNRQGEEGRGCGRTFEGLRRERCRKLTLWLGKKGGEAEKPFRVLVKEAAKQSSNVFTVVAAMGRY